MYCTVVQQDPSFMYCPAVR